MNSEKIFVSALHYEKKIRDLYLSAAKSTDDDRGKKIFNALAEDEQSHVNFLEHSIDVLKRDGRVDASKINSSIPPKNLYHEQIETMRKTIPDQILGDIKRILTSALKLEIETSEFYANTCKRTEGPVREVFEKLLEIEKRHEDIVQIELDHASNYGCWFNFMEIDMEHG